MKRWASIIVATLALALAGPATADPPIWIVRDEDSTLVMFGSVHVLPDDVHWRTPALSAALAEADELWFEIPLGADTDSEISRRMLLAGLLPPGETLSGRLPPEDAARLERVAAQLSLYRPGLDRLRPWLAELTLAIAVDTRAGAEVDNGVERRLNAEAPPTLMRRSLETVEQQVQILSGATEAVQIASLSLTLREIEEDPHALGRVVAAWHAGDTTALANEAVTPLRVRAPEAYDRLIVRRNRAWVAQLRERLAGSGYSLVVVGVGHLVGPDSVPAMLRAQGVTVEGP